MSSGEAITSILSGAAIVVAGLSLWLTFSRDRHDLAVKVTWSTPGRYASATEIVFDEPVHLTINVMNDGRYAERVSAVGIDGAGANRPHLQLTSPQHFPKGEPGRLEPGDSWLAWIERQALEAAWDGPGELGRAFVMCASGREYRSRFRVGDMLRSGRLSRRSILPSMPRRFHRRRG